MAKRIHKVQDFLYEHHIDSLLIKSKTMKKWLSTLTGSGCQILITKNSAYIILDGRYYAEAKEKERDLEIVLCNPHNSQKTSIDIIKEILVKDNCQSLGLEASFTLALEYQKMVELGVKLVLLDKEITNLRMIKEQEELEIVKKAVELTDQIYQKVIKEIKVGMSEYEISALVQYYAISSGAQQMAFDTVVATGERTAFPHARPTDRRVQAHEPIMIDFGIQYQNYQSDMTRVCFIGEPTQQIRNIYDVVLKAQLAGLAAIKKGVVASEVDMAARTVIEEAGYGKYFDHGLGHGLGIGDGSDGPILNANSQTILSDYMIMSCEPGVYIPGVGGIRIEDDVVIINGKGVALNKTTKEYIILEEQ